MKLFKNSQKYKILLIVAIFFSRTTECMEDRQKHSAPLWHIGPNRHSRELLEPARGELLLWEGPDCFPKSHNNRTIIIDENSDHYNQENQEAYIEAVYQMSFGVFLKKDSLKTQKLSSEEQEEEFTPLKK